MVDIHVAVPVDTLGTSASLTLTNVPPPVLASMVFVSTQMEDTCVTVLKVTKV